jgi:hypothetical protein
MDVDRQGKYFGHHRSGEKSLESQVRIVDIALAL